MSEAGFIQYPYTPCPLESTMDITALHTAFVHSMQGEYTSQSESHDFWEIMVVLEGELSVVTGEYALLLPKNSMIIHPPMAIHRHFNPNRDRNTYGVISFSARQLPVTENAVYTLSARQVEQFRDMIRLIRNQYEMDKICVVKKKASARPSAPQEIKSGLEHFLSKALFSQTVPYQHTSRDYRRIVSYLTRNLHRSLCLSQIAEDLEMSSANLRRIFTLYAGMGVMKYFSHLKVQKAISLLEEGFSVREVSEMLSFSSQSAFSTAFKNATGVSPSKYHKN